MLQNGRKSGVAAVVRPVGVQDTKFGLGRVAVLVAEVFHHLAQVVRIHCQPPLLAEGRKIRLSHVGESVQRGERFDVGVLNLLQAGQVFLPCFYGIDIVMAYAGKILIAERVVEDEQAGTTNLNSRLRVN